MDKKEKVPTQWEEVSPKQTLPKRGIFINIDGPEGTGKSSLALTMAELGTVAVIDTDQSLDRAQRPEMPKGRKFSARKVTVKYVAGLSEDKVRNNCMAAWKRAKSAAIDAATGDSKTIIADTGTELWEVLRLGAFGTLTPRGRTDSLYGPVNAEFRQFIRRIHRHHGKHLIFVNQMKDQWGVDKKGDSVRTGKLERVGFKELGYLADMTLETYAKNGKFGVKVKVCKLAPNGPAMEGATFEDEDVNLPHILSVMTDTEKGDWLK